ncbi:hypothetical protein SAMN04489743_2082 [Pseudarthrobacter equi]|uniref:Uncharacterized protein n=1 Tax=Pseudarthrobacter equi TaxID=728066 RepID=A0A1H1YMN8_9MICC|nr:hypothetical protein SAMN04489743_2082 [Pseudarthrobacter equi]
MHNAGPIRGGLGGYNNDHEFLGYRQFVRPENTRPGLRIRKASSRSQQSVGLRPKDAHPKWVHSQTAC